MLNAFDTKKKKGKPQNVVYMRSNTKFFIIRMTNLMELLVNSMESSIYQIRQQGMDYIGNKTLNNNLNIYGSLSEFGFQLQS